MGLTLFVITLVVLLVVVLALVVYLLGIILALRRAGDNLAQLNAGLAAIARDTDPLAGKLTTINGALGQLLTGLRSVNGHLAGVAKLLAR